MKRILTLLKQDWTNILRDNVLFYIFLAPVIMAIAVRLLAPSFESVTLRFAVNKTMPQSIQENLAAYGKVIVLPDRAALVDRVEKNDDVPGIFWDNGQYEIILQGNEPEGERLTQIVLTQAVSPNETASFEVTTHPKAPLFSEYGLIFVIISAIMLGAVLESFNMVQDKESGMIRAWAVSPLKMIEMTAARAVFSIAAGLLMTVISVLIIAGIDVPWNQVLIGFFASAGMAILMGFLLGGLSSSQLQMLALMKFVLMIYTVLPVVSIFVSEKWQFLFFPFPNYWMFVIFENIFVGSDVAPVGFWAACGLTVAVTVAYLAVLYPILQKRLRLK